MMQAVILAGGLGTRLSEETSSIPKPMVEIGGRPILWHVMKIISMYGIRDFIICCGYKGHLIKEYFANYPAYASDFTIDIGTGTKNILSKPTEDWSVTLVDTGGNTQTGGRIKKIKNFLTGPFLMTYGDGVSDVNLQTLFDFHNTNKLLATVTAVQPPGRFGSLKIEEHRVDSFLEKPDGDGGWINGGFFVLDPSVIDFIEGDDTVWELLPMATLAKRGELAAYKHKGFWRPMDTLRDKILLNDLWANGNAPWKMWDD